MEGRFSVVLEPGEELLLATGAGFRPRQYNASGVRRVPLPVTAWLSVWLVVWAFARLGFATVGGTLCLTNRRLYFAPHAWDRLTGNGAEVNLDLRAITEVRGKGAAGLFAQTLTVSCGEETYTFLVRGLDAVVNALQAAQSALGKSGFYWTA